jgi:hypothetical protein
MDDERENESLLRMRRMVSTWLATENWNTQQLINWLQGYDLPAEGQDEEPYLALLRGIPDADEKYATERAYAQRVAMLLNEKPDVKRPGKRPNQILYNLFMLCAGLSSPDDLFDPLCAVLERGKVAVNWRGVDVRTALKAALILNQGDERLLPVWERAVQKDNAGFLVLDEYEFLEAARFMPPSRAERGKPALNVIGKALKLIATREEPEEDREVIFRSILEKVMNSYPGWTWGRDLLLQSVEHGWPKWAIESIPATSPEYAVRIIQSVKASPYTNERSIMGIIVHGFSVTADAQPNARGIEEAHKSGLKSLAVGSR